MINDNDKEGEAVTLKKATSTVTLKDTDIPVSERVDILNTATTAKTELNEDYLLIKQIEAEHRWLDKGNSRYWRNLERSEKSAPAHVSGITQIQSDLYAEVSAILKRAITKASTSPNKPNWYEYVAPIQPDILAYYAVSTMGEAFVANWDRQRYMKHVGLRVQVEHNVCLIKEAVGRDTYSAWERETIEAYRTPHKRDLSILAKGEKRAGVEQIKWPDSTLMKVGFFLWMAVTQTSAFTEDRRKEWCNKAKKLKDRIRPKLTEDALRKVQDFRTQKEWQKPAIEPMISPPNDWSDTSKPFHTTDLNAVTQMVTNVQPDHLAVLHEAYRTGSAKVFYNALNHTQQTEYAIDAEMLEFVAQCIERKLWRLEGLPRTELHPEMKRPDNYAELGKEDKNEINEQIQEIELENLSIERDAWQWSMEYGQALSFLNYERIQLAWKVDKRGRFVCTTMLNPQRGDHIRCLFSYRRGKPVTASGLMHLKRFIATLYSEGALWKDQPKKLDKMSHKAREQWTDDNYDTLLAIASDPFAHLALWEEASEPMQFIKAIKLLANVHKHGVGYMTGFVPFIDATSSGTQIFSAISRSLFDGALCNLVPMEEPANIYQVVADKALQAVNDDLAGADKEKATNANIWLATGHPSIKSSKRNTMTLGYDSKVSGMSDQLYEDIVKPERRKKLATGNNHNFPNSKKDQRKACRYLAEINNTAISATLPSARAGLTFLKKVITPLAREQKPQYWRLRSGFVAVNEYYHLNQREVKIPRLNVKAGVNEGRAKTSYAELDTSRIDLRESKQGIGANFVHSRDADHTHHILFTCKAQGISDVTHIHDCFGTHLADMDKLNHIVRATFVYLYGGDWCAYEAFANDIAKQLDDKTKAISPDEKPSKGTLNIAGVMDSDYFMY